ncbi:MAG TPA: hypothetical protein VGM63_09780, partial [Mucilaginibacter sp.]
MSVFKQYFIKNKLIYAGIFFLVYMLYRTFGCPIIGYLCGQELEYFTPVFLIITYYSSIFIFVLVTNFIKPIKDWKNKLIDFFGENSFYITSIMILYEDRF